MAISVDWPTKLISVPKADMTLVDSGPPEVRALDIEDLWLALRDLEDEEDGMPFDKTCDTVPPKTVAGVTLGRVLEIVNGYTLQFENGTYAVNITGGNSNLADVMVRNSVGVNTANSAGYQIVETGTSGLTSEESTWLSSVPGIETDVASIESSITTIQGDLSTLSSNVAAIVTDVATLEGDVATIAAIEEGRWAIVGSVLTYYDTDNVTPVAVFELRDAAGNPTSVMANVVERVRTGP